MKRTLTFSALFIGTLLLVGCGAATPPAGQPGVPVPPPTGTAVSVASSSAPRISDAKPLGMTQQELRTEISAGKSLKDILKSRGVIVPAASSSAAKK